STKRGDYYLTITESKKRFNKDGSHYFEKHKLFLYKEDFDKFADGLHETVEYIKENQQPLDPPENYSESGESEESNEFTNVDFEDLEDKN
ncbi:MAG: DNA-binding protein, partial [Marinilabiliales bacterium]